jgi:hypothetical protein
MQVTLNLVDWTELLKLGTPKAFLDFFYEVEDDPRWLAPGERFGWDSDSFLQYNEVAWAIEGILDRLTPSERQQVVAGLLPLISQGKQIDEFGMSPASEGYWWISASPGTTRKIHDNLSRLDLQRLGALVQKVRPPDAGELVDHVDTDFIPFIEQHRRVVAAAVTRGWGLLGHCG